MAHVLDAFALLAMALDEPAADEVEAVIRRGDGRVASVNLAETLDQLGRVHGHSQESLEAVFGPFLAEAVEVVGAGERLAWRAAALRRRHYRRRASELSLADCFALALPEGDDTIVTADSALLRAARAEGIAVRALPDARGRRPAVGR
jgi:PIN domain nuclease of toxin-antitoxin system